MRGLWLFLASFVCAPGNSLAEDFYNQGHWKDGKAEMLYYEVTRSYRGNPMRESAVWITEMGMYRPGTGEFLRGKDSLGLKVLQATLRRPGFAEETPVSSLAVLQLDLKLPTQHWWQHVVFTGVYGGHWREMAVDGNKISLSVRSTGGEASKVSEEYKPPVFTEEMLFTHLRSLPQRLSTVSEVWLLDSQLGDTPTYKAQYARIEVEKELVVLREMATCQFRISRADGKILRFWLHREGLHPVVKAVLPDKSEWTLQRWERKKYWSF